jgi:hypothetical protein
MKNLGFLSLFLLLSVSATSYTQFSLESNFNVVHTGRNQSLLAKYQWNKFALLAGLKYNFNKEYSFPQRQRDFYKKAFWAINFQERMGLEIGTQFTIFERENIVLSLFHQSQLTKSHIRHEVFMAIYPHVLVVPGDEPQSEYDFAYELSKKFIGPVWALENNFGLSLQAYFTNELYFSTKLGGGILFYKNTDQNNIIVTGGNWELSEVLSMGLGWKFNRNK